MNTQRGFTLLQLLIAFAILFIIIGIAIPSYSSASARAQSGVVESAIFTSLNDAQNFSFINANRAVLCPSKDGMRCERSHNWSKGWIVFEDINGNRERDASDRKIGGHSQTFEDLHILTSEGRTRIAFQSGGGNFGSNAHFKLCDDRAPARARSLFISNTGRVRAAKNPQISCPV